MIFISLITYSSQMFSHVKCKICVSLTFYKQLLLNISTKMHNLIMSTLPHVKQFFKTIFLPHDAFYLKTGSLHSLFPALHSHLGMCLLPCTSFSLIPTLPHLCVSTQTAAE